MSVTTGTGTVEAKLEWWRRSSFTLIGIIVALLGVWFTMLKADVATNEQSIARNADAINALRVDIGILTTSVDALVRAQESTVIQLAELTGRLDEIRDSGE